MCRHGENWSGITDQKQRKKLQNRLNKRLSRQRQRATRSSQSRSESSATHCSAAIRSSPNLNQLSCNAPASDAEAESIVPMLNYASQDTIAQQRALLEAFARQALSSYAAGCPRADHYLQLIQLNIVTGLTRNAEVLGFSFDWLVCEIVSPFGPRDVSGNRERQLEDCTTYTKQCVPPSLAPTKMQLTTPHHPWLDLFPLPRLRDNMLATTRCMPLEEEDELFDHILEASGPKREWAGFMVWGEPWDPRSWEVSVPFLRNWGFLLRGCPEIIMSTNAWRRRRREQPIMDLRCVEEIPTSWKPD
ncbi:uncharacterized protein B0I36DRAFT_375104 [Microdochium trichocladiopsis]|uniref:BZIP domain-containing protein n=1 Tax=Microdochium trichocladiopsis TaxID=1682393 RepID=A0A9P9BTE8_9PEZI|nr:uncharacterized protein B0I36DRAFT_375104 [Microdochium trichocladiopsis]KAH7029771.1 hypothetical protein B0I36DRAFT_375104 [Microdochium trichocladiopsis]